MPKPKLIILTIFSVGCTVATAILINVITANPNSLPIAGPLLLAVIVVGISVTVTFYQSQVPDNRPPPSVFKRKEFLRSLRKSFEKKKDQSLLGSSMMPLELRGLSNALQFLKDQAQPLAPASFDERILEIYDKVEGALLILGELGSGKTTLLLTLALGLINQSENDEKRSIPVVFNLASWAQRRLSIADWLIEELCHTYEVDRRSSQIWVNSGEILPLLDSLDEVPVVYRQACIDAINTYWRDRRSSAPIVVCCRSADYLGQVRHLEVNGVIVVEPLTIGQIDHYLSGSGEQFAEVREVLHTDPVLLERVKTPLMLRVLIQACQGISARDLLASSSPEVRRRQLLRSYVQRMLAEQYQDGWDGTYKSEETIERLVWLARELTQHSESEFFIKQVQPAWLATRRSLWRYLDIGARWFIGLGAGLLGGQAWGLLFERVFPENLFPGLMIGLLFGIPFVLSVDLIDVEMRMPAGIKQPDMSTWPPRTWKNFTDFLNNLKVWFLETCQSFIDFLSDRLAHGLLGGLVGGYFIGLIAGLLGNAGVLALEITFILSGFMIIMFYSIPALEQPSRGLWYFMLDTRPLVLLQKASGILRIV